jgi:hypothetical protein
MPDPSGASTQERIVFTSTIYPYSLSLPGDAIRGAWQPAIEEWHGVQRIDSFGPLADRTLVDDGTLVLYGTAWDEGLQAFGEMAYANGVEYHACSPAPDSVEDLEAAGDPALLYRMQCGGVPVARIVWVRNGYGLAVAQLLNPSDQESVERFVARLESLTWISR